MKPSLTLTPGTLTLDQLRRAFFSPHQIELDHDVGAAIDRGRATVDAVIERDEVTYGINTGFGRLAQKTIETARLSELQRNLILSHGTGVGPLLDDATVRMILLLKINALARGYSGVRKRLVNALVTLHNRQLYPAIPCKGSVGASGDLAPLAHMSLPLMGLGEVRHNGVLQDSATALGEVGLNPLELKAKEGLALLNGTQVSTALALRGLFDAERNVNAAMITGAMTVEAALGSRTPFDADISALRGQAGQIEAARIYRLLLEDSQIGLSHEHCDRVQDPYSLRCQPQVMGACLDQMRHAAKVLTVEANAVSDNPLVLPDRDVVLSGGNFHAEPVALVADNLALAIAETGALSERRMALLIDSSLSQLPPFLVEDAGVNSGFMIAQVTAAALASENKSLAHPASVDSLPTSANQEDHVSMATFAARRLSDMNENTRYVLAVELLAAAQSIDLRRPLRSNPIIEGAHEAVRTVVAKWEQDRYFQPDLEAVAALIGDGVFGTWVNDFIGQ
ncbi:MAG: histidine ammonia-lyase [Gammaproteobacteria bacterium]